MSEWDIVEEEIKRSKIARFNWKTILGETLTRKVAILYAEGKSFQEAYNTICVLIELTDHDMETKAEMIRRAKIGVAARFGEIKSESRIIRDKSRELAS